MSEQATQQGLVKKCADYLRATYNEELVEYDILDDSVDDGEGTLQMECVVKAGGSTSRWQKTFTFANSRVVNMSWRFLG